MRKYITMIKNIKLLSFLLCAPVVAGAADHCTNPDEYTVDRRCYVTDEQKTQKPFSSVVALVEKGDIYCTGTLVKWVVLNDLNHGADDIFLFTAKHCTGNDEDGQPDEVLQIKTQDENIFQVRVVKTGNYNITSGAYGANRKTGDWAVYKLNREDAGKVNHIMAYGQSVNNGDAMIIGYGSLKIMSDAEIEDFRQKYIDFLKDCGDKDAAYEIYNAEVDESIETDDSNWIYKDFKKNLDIWYRKELFLDDGLKVSECKYNSESDENRCQVWGGNSGGPVFDKQLKGLIGIVSTGYDVIGGYYHAGFYDALSPSNISPIGLQKDNQ